MNDEHRYPQGLTQLELTINAPWESLAMTLDQHPFSEMGDPSIEGSGAWHLIHMVEVFRNHSKHVLGDSEIQQWVPFPDRSVDSLPEWVEILHDDCARFVDWCSEPENRNALSQIEYGEDHSLDQMLGVMLRHIVWHSGAIHYWCIWKGPNQGS